MVGDDELGDNGATFPRLVTVEPTNVHVMSAFEVLMARRLLHALCCEPSLVPFSGIPQATLTWCCRESKHRICMLHGVKINQSIDRSIGLGLAIFPAHTLDTLNWLNCQRGHQKVLITITRC